MCFAAAAGATTTTTTFINPSHFVFCEGMSSSLQWKAATSRPGVLCPIRPISNAIGAYSWHQCRGLPQTRTILGVLVYYFDSWVVDANVDHSVAAGGGDGGGGGVAAREDDNDW